MDDDALLEGLRRRDAVSPDGSVRRATAYRAAEPEEIASTETALGFRIPPLLRRIYLEVADGGFGPAYGFYPLRPGQKETLVEARNKLAADPAWPRLLLPICDWGCAIWSCLDCRTDDGPVVTPAGEDGFRDTGRDLRSWLGAWLAGTDLWDEMFEPGPTLVMMNPFTKKPMERKGLGKPTGRPWP